MTLSKRRRRNLKRVEKYMAWGVWMLTAAGASGITFSRPEDQKNFDIVLSERRQRDEQPVGGGCWRGIRVGKY